MLERPVGAELGGLGGLDRNVAAVVDRPHRGLVVKPHLADGGARGASGSEGDGDGEADHQNSGLRERTSNTGSNVREKKTSPSTDEDSVKRARKASLLWSWSPPP